MLTPRAKALMIGRHIGKMAEVHRVSEARYLANAVVYDAILEYCEALALGYADINQKAAAIKVQISLRHKGDWMRSMAARSKAARERAEIKDEAAREMKRELSEGNSVGGGAQEGVLGQSGV